MTKLYLKLSGTTIMGHDYNSHDEYNTEVNAGRLVDLDGNYKYKYDNGLVALTDEEINAHPYKIQKDEAVQEKLNKEARKTAAKLLKQKVKNKDSLSKDELATIIEALIDLLG